MNATPDESPAPLAPRASGPVGRLPPVMLQDAARRTAWLCLSIAILVPALQVFQRLMQPGLYIAMMNDANRLMALAMVLLAVGVFALHRYRVLGPSTILSLGMALEVFGAFAISMIETSVPIRADQPVLGVSKLGPWIVAFGVIIPNRPRWTLIYASAAAGTWPLAYALNAAQFHYTATSWGQLGVWPLFNAFMVVLTYCIGRQTYGLALTAGTALELGSYRLVAPIGEGGMGEVWKADHQMLARKAAIKLIRPQAQSGRQADLAVRRFRREADAIASLQSPHTVYLYDFGISQDGRFYYAMELLDGISLQSLVTTFGPQPAARVLPILMQVCASLEEAHARGLVHRDLKPSNVMLCKVALTYDFVKVLDFGLAKFIHNAEVSQLTMVGTATGTPGYIAPEIAIGESSVDGRADLYALGCVAYFLLTGALVFEETNPMKMALQHVQAAPIPPSARTTLPIPDALERIVLHCLAKAPGDRPASATALAAMLSAAAADRWADADAETWWSLHLPSTSALRTFNQAPIHTPAIVRKI
jgi:tRNA A-37 threonylcarbamoyl transferase component Bud32